MKQLQRHISGEQGRSDGSSLNLGSPIKRDASSNSGFSKAASGIFKINNRRISSMFLYNTKDSDATDNEWINSKKINELVSSLSSMRKVSWKWPVLNKMISSRIFNMFVDARTRANFNLVHCESGIAIYAREISLEQKFENENVDADYQADGVLTNSSNEVLENGNERPEVIYKYFSALIDLYKLFFINILIYIYI